jgi:hypothetical protein
LRSCVAVKHCSFRGIRFSVGGLKGIEKMVKREKISEMRFDNLPNQLRRNETRDIILHVVREIFSVEIKLLETTNSCRGFEFIRKNDSIKG